MKSFLDSLTLSIKSMKYEKKINLSSQLKGFYGKHRSGWNYVLKYLKQLHNKRGLLLDSFIERTFCWLPGGAKANLETWIGFTHVPPKVPEWFQYEQSNDFIFNTAHWKISLPYCKGLFTLSRYHRESLKKKIDLPINNLIHPTETPDLKWSWNRFEANRDKKIVQIGWWLRKLHTIFQLSNVDYKKIFLRINYTNLDDLLKKEREILKERRQFNDSMYDTVESISFVSNKEYDKLLSENLVIINLYDSSANNTLIECFVRNTPLLINPIEPVVEYLGEDYPFYFSSLEEAAEKAMDFDLIHETHKFLENHPMKYKLTGQYFLESFTNSQIYRNL